MLHSSSHATDKRRHTYDKTTITFKATIKARTVSAMA
jgi:hypothetical protein